MREETSQVAMRELLQGGAGVGEREARLYRSFTTKDR